MPNRYRRLPLRSDPPRARTWKTGCMGRLGICEAMRSRALLQPDAFLAVVDDDSAGAAPWACAQAARQWVQLVRGRHT